MVNRGYLYKKEIKFILNYVVALCKVEQVFVMEELKEIKDQLQSGNVPMAIKKVDEGIACDFDNQIPCQGQSSILFRNEKN